MCPKNALNPVLLRFRYKKKKSISLQSRQSLFETQASPKRKHFIFQMQVFTSEKVLQGKKPAAVMTTNTEFFGCGFA